MHFVKGPVWETCQLSAVGTTRTWESDIAIITTRPAITFSQPLKVSSTIRKTIMTSKIVK